MTIVKAKSFIESYRAKARSNDINELSGRTGRSDLTRFVINEMARKLPTETNTILVDVGCGDGLFLLKSADNGLDSFRGRLIGILPTTEEVARVRNHLLLESNTKRHLISIELGLAEKINLPSNYCDILACNGVLLLLQNKKNVSAALMEFHRITKTGGTIFIGEMPETNEMAGKNYGDSITSWLYFVLKNQGFRSFLTRLKQTLLTLFSSEPFVISPKNHFYMPPVNFIALLAEHGIEVAEHYKHKEIDNEGNIFESKTRWDYIAVKR